jgi:Flp pilus assembly protein TadG
MKTTRGNTVLEFALVLPALLLLVIGFIEISLMTYDKAMINSASREGARYGTIYRGGTYATTNATINYTKNLLLNKLMSFSSSSAIEVKATSSDPSPESGDQLTVTVSYTYGGLLLYTLIGQPKMMNLSSKTTLSYE